MLTHLQRARQWRIPDCQANEQEKLQLEKDDMRLCTLIIHGGAQPSSLQVRLFSLA